MVATKSEWDSATPERKIEILADDACDLRQTIGNLQRRLDNIVCKTDKNFRDASERMETLEKRISKIEES